MAANDAKPSNDDVLGRRSIDQLVPNYDFVERHHIDINATPHDCYTASRHLDFSDSRAIRWLFTIRRLHNKELSIDEMIAGGRFAIVAEEPPSEFVIGLASSGLAAITISDADHFAGLQPNRGLKIAWNFQTQPLANGRTRLHTETRVACFGRLTKIAFTA